MRPVTPRTAIVLALALLGPALAAGVAADDEAGLDPTGDDPTTVTVAPTRVGDAYRVDEHLHLPENDGTSTRIVTVEAPDTARDRYGIERETVPFLVQRRVDGDPVSAERCHGARGHVDTVQRVPLLGDGLRRSVEVATEDHDDGGGALWTEENPRRTEVLATFDPQPCYGRNPLAGRTLEEGDRARLALFQPHLAEATRPSADDPVLSAPAEATTFHGRDALRFRFGDVTYATSPGHNATPVGVAGSYTFVVADGLPGVVRTQQSLGLDLDISFSVGCWGCPPDPPPTGAAYDAEPSGEGWDFDIDVDFRFTHSTELAGFERGNGTTLQAPALDPLVPPTTPHDGTRGVGHQTAYATGFDLPYPQEKAWRDVLADPATTAYLARHDDAYVTAMTYDRGKRPEHPEQATTDGGWTFLLRDDERTLRVTTTQVTGAEAADTTVESPREAAVKDHDTWREGWTVPREDLPAEVPDGDALARPVAAHGLSPDEVRHLSAQVQADGDEGLRIPVHVANVSYDDPPEDARGVEMRLEATDGGLTRILHTEPVQKDEGTWAGAYPDDLEEREASTAAFGLPAGPESGAGLAAASAAGIGLLALLAKLVLLPLYARLQDDELLDDPVRRALHQRAKEDPGVHQAALVEEADVGKGAALHHLRKLHDADLLARFEQGGYVRYYVPGEVAPEEARRQAVLRAGSNRDVYQALQDDPGRSLRDVAREVGVSAPTVHRSVEQLREAGLVDDGATA